MASGFRARPQRTYLSKDFCKEIIIRNPSKREVLKGPGSGLGFRGAGSWVENLQSMWEIFS